MGQVSPYGIYLDYTGINGHEKHTRKKHDSCFYFGVSPGSEHFQGIWKLDFSDCLDSEGIQRLVWPARSPDLNPIENVGDALGRQVAGRNYPPTNKNTLIRALTEEWDKLPQQLLDNVVQSIIRRVERCITLHGGHIPY
ncbi:transposable element Tc3 transposase [Trichonephila clavipes]|nr:transposable element Tc3 transposase [Trichonephila clavipes]